MTPRRIKFPSRGCLHLRVSAASPGGPWVALGVLPSPRVLGLAWESQTPGSGRGGKDMGTWVQVSSGLRKAGAETGVEGQEVWWQEWGRGGSSLSCVPAPLGPRDPPLCTSAVGPKQDARPACCHLSVCRVAPSSCIPVPIVTGFCAPGPLRAPCPPSSGDFETPLPADDLTPPGDAHVAWGGVRPRGTWGQPWGRLFHSKQGAGPARNAPVQALL